MKILGWIIMIPVVLFVLLIVARLAFCGANSADVRVMKPMAEKIADYIVKNGIPESLEDIHDLPHELVGCKKVVVGTEICKYDIYFIVKVRGDQNNFRIDIENKNSETGIYYELEFNKNMQKWEDIKHDSYSRKSSGICTRFKQ